MNNVYARAYTEVLEILSHLTEEEYSKIPVEKIEFYKQSMDKEYSFKIDPEIDLEVQNISQEARAVIVTLYRDYFATEEQKAVLQEILDLNEKKLENKKRLKYNSDNLFKKERNDIEQVQLIEYKETFFSKFKKFIFKLLHLHIEP